MPKDDAEKEQIARELVSRALRDYLATAIDDEVMIEAAVARDLTQGYRMNLNFKYIQGSFTVRLEHLALALLEKFDAQIDEFTITMPDGVKSFAWKDAEEREETLEFFTDFAICYLLPKLGHYVSEALEALLDHSFAFAKTTGRVRIAQNYDKAMNVGLDMPALISDMKDVVKQTPPDKQDYVRRALEHYSQLQVRPVKGRPRTWTKETLENAVRKASSQIKREKYRTPTLADVARILNKRNPDRMRLTAKSLGEMLRRYEVDWKSIKSHINGLK